ncbi:tRNA dihydrouridine synthase [Linderina macrospora]|uniref:tRNA dihydrouridine synthase n=1 Tax=Linderina macrospora TaxID=4868 RepID=A0ACC1J1K7_9FUNG|nr:tRNA dihydrouridine synthase [Linderina macrospora]
MAEEYIEICKQVPTKNSYVRGHLFKLFRYSLPIHTDLRQQLAQARTPEEVEKFVQDMKNRLIEDEEKAGKFDPENVIVDEFGYRKYPHWICQPALRFEHDKEHSQSKRLLNEAKANPVKNDEESKKTVREEGEENEANAKRQKVAAA